MNKKLPKDINFLINILKKLPGVGLKTAERYAFHMLKWDEKNIKELTSSIERLKNINSCPICGCFLSNDLCEICNDKNRNTKVICLLASPKDIYSFEETQSYNGLYHIIDELISPMYEIDENCLHLDKLIARIEKNNVKEVIIAFDSTLEGDATSLYIKNKLKPLKHISISRLAFGLPIGSSFDFIDGGTLTRALTGRQSF